MDQDLINKYVVYGITGLFIGILLKLLTNNNTVVFVLVLGLIIGIVVKKIIILKKQKENKTRFKKEYNLG